MSLLIFLLLEVLRLIIFPRFLCPGSLFGVVWFLKHVLWPIVCFWFAYYYDNWRLFFGFVFSFIIGRIGFGLWFECINMDLFSMVWRHITWLCISIGSLFFIVVDMPCSIHVAFGFSWLGSALDGISFISLGTLVLLLHGTFSVKFVQQMTSFHWRFGPFLALLFLLDIIVVCWISLLSLSCASAKWFAWWLSVVP